MKRILLLNDTVDHDNWGSNACADALRKVLCEAIDDLEITSILSRWTTRRYRKSPSWLGNKVYWQPSRIYDRYSKTFDFHPRFADEFDLVAEDWLSGHGGPPVDEFIEKAKSVDAVVFNAEGSTYRNNLSCLRCLFALWFAKTRLGKACFFVNGSVTLTSVDPILPAIIGKTFAAIDGVAVREPRSLRNLRSYFPDLKAQLVPDSVFYFSGQSVDDRIGSIQPFIDQINDQPFFCLSLSMMQSMIPGYLRYGAKNSSLFDLIRALKNIVPNAVLMARDGPDLAIIREVAEVTKSPVFGPQHNYLDMIALLQKAQFVVSGRYHHLILSVIAGCPAIALRTSSHKIDGLCELLEGEIGVPFDATDLRPQIGDICQFAERQKSDSVGKKQRLNELAVRFHKETNQLGEMVREALV